MRYKYKTIPFTNDEISHSCEGLTAKLSQAGERGWELVTIFSQKGLGSSAYTIFGVAQK